MTPNKIKYEDLKNSIENEKKNRFKVGTKSSGSSWNNYLKQYLQQPSPGKNLIIFPQPQKHLPSIFLSLKHVLNIYCSSSRQQQAKGDFSGSSMCYTVRSKNDKIVWLQMYI